MALASIINGLGIVRSLVRLSQYLQRRDTLQFAHCWTYSLFAVHQFLLHILLWWLLWGVREATQLDFLAYMYLLMGPILLFLSTSLLTPELREDDVEVDFNKLYFNVRPVYFTFIVLLWTWALFIRPLLRGLIAPATPIIVAYIVAALVLRLGKNEKLHFSLGIVHWLIFAAYVVFFAGQFDGMAASAP